MSSFDLKIHRLGSDENPSLFDEDIELVEHLINVFNSGTKKSLSQFHDDPSVQYVFEYYRKGIIRNWEFCRKYLKSPTFDKSYKGNFSESIQYFRRHLENVELYFEDDVKEFKLNQTKIFYDADYLYDAEIIFNSYLEAQKILPKNASYSENNFEKNTSEDFNLNRYIDNGWNVYSKKLILKQKTKEYTDYVKQKFEFYNREYREGRINIAVVMDVCSYISSIQCGNSEPFNNSYKKNTLDYDYKKAFSDKIWKSIYPILSDTGAFAINTYLYAFFNDIILVGIPNQQSVADSILRCPYQFLYHDFGHVSDFREDEIGIIIKNNRDIYYEILNRKYYPINDKTKVTIKEKEVMVMMFWWFIHEIAFSNFINFALYREIGDMNFETFNKEYNIPNDDYENLEINWTDYYEVMKEIRDRYIQLYSKKEFEEEFNTRITFFNSPSKMTQDGRKDLTRVGKSRGQYEGNELYFSCCKMASWYMFYNIYHFDSLR